MKLLTIFLILISFLLLSLLVYLVLVQDECRENKEKNFDDNKEYINDEWQALCMEGCDWDEECVEEKCEKV